MPGQGQVLATAVVRLQADTKRFQADANRASASLRGVQAQAQRTQRGMGTLAKAVTAAAGGFVLFAGVRGVRAGVQGLLNFDDAMQQSLSIMGDVSSRMRGEMVQAARDVGEELNFAAEEGGRAFFFLASAGLDAEQSVAALPQVARFARAGMFDFATATDLATDAQSALGLTVQDAQQNLQNLTRVTDVLVKANTLANATVEQFSTALTTEAGAAMKTFSIDVEEGTAVLAAFADQGIKGQVAGSGFSRILRLMSQAAVNNKEEMEALGVEFFDAQGNLRNLADIVENLETVFGDMSDEQRAAGLEAIGFTARVQGILLPLLGTSEAIREYERDLRRAGGTTRDVAEKQMESLRNQIGRLRRRFENWRTEILEKTVPALKALIDNMETVLDTAKVLALFIGAAGLAKAFQFLAARLAVTTAAFLASAQAFGFWATVVTSAKLAAAALAGLLTPGAVLLAGLAALAVVLVKGQEEIRAINDEFGNMEERIDAAAESLRKLNKEQITLVFQGESAKLDQLEAQAARLRADLEAAPQSGLGAQAAKIQAELTTVNRKIEIQKALLKEVEDAYSAASIKAQELAGTEPPPTPDPGDIRTLGEELEEFAERVGNIQDALDAGIFDFVGGTPELGNALAIMEEMEQTAARLRAISNDTTASLPDRTRAAQMLAAVMDVIAGLAREINGEMRDVEPTIDDLSGGTERLQQILRMNNETLREARRRWREANDEAQRQARIAQDIEEAIRNLFEQAAKGIQEALADAFATVFEEGIDGFKDFADRILSIFQDVASQIAAVFVAEKLKIPELLASIQEGETPGGFGNLIAGLAGFGAGQSGGTLSGILAGGLSGFATGGPIGALIGGLGGVLGGLFGGGPSQQDIIQEERNRILQENNARIQELSDALRERARTAAEAIDTGNIARRLAEAFGNFETSNSSLLQLLGIPSPEEFLEGLGVSLQEIEKLAEDLGITIRDSAGNLIPDALRQLQEAAVQLAAQIHQNEQRFLQQLELRALEAQGLDEEAQALRNVISFTEQLREARKQGFSEEAIERLKEIIALEQAAEAIERANRARERERQLAEQRARLFADFEARRLALEGKTQQAQIAAIEERARQEIESLKQLQREGTITAEEMRRFAAIIDAEVLQAIEDVIAEEQRLAEERRRAEEAARKAAAAEEFKRLADLQNLRIRLLVAQGREEEAQAMRNELALLRAVQEGRSAQFISLLRQVQAAEQARDAQRDLERAAEDSNRAIRGVTRALNAPAGLRLSLLRFRAAVVGEAGGPTFAQATGFTMSQNGTLAGGSSPSRLSRTGEGAQEVTNNTQITNQFGGVTLRVSEQDSPEQVLEKWKQALVQVTRAGGVNPAEVLPTV